MPDRDLWPGRDTKVSCEIRQFEKQVEEPWLKIVSGMVTMLQMGGRKAVCRKNQAGWHSKWQICN